MRASSGFPLAQLIVLFVSTSPLLGGKAHAEAPAVALGWNWMDVRLRTTSGGGQEIRVRGATLNLGEPGEPDLPAVLVRVRAPEQSRPSSYRIAGERVSLRPFQWVVSLRQPCVNAT